MANAEAREELVRLTGRMAVPEIVVDGQVVVGFDRAKLQARLDELRVELDGLLVRVDGLVVEPLLRVIDLAEAQIDLGVDRVEYERLLVRRDRRIDLTLGGARVSEPDVGIGVEGPELERLVVRLDGLIEEAPRRRQEQVPERLERLRIGRVELRRGAELRGRLPAVAERLVHRPES